MIGHTSSTASIFDVPDGGDLVVALLFAGSTIVAIATIVAVLGDSKCRARVVVGRPTGRRGRRPPGQPGPGHASRGARRRPTR